jgi:hypothetical protein
MYGLSVYGSSGKKTTRRTRPVEFVERIRERLRGHNSVWKTEPATGADDSQWLRTEEAHYPHPPRPATRLPCLLPTHPQAPA